MILLLLLAPLQAQDDAARGFIEKLRSERIEERDEAMKGLKALGPAARPALEKAARDSDADVAERARQVLRAFEIAGRLSPGLLRARPGLEDRLAASEAAWTSIFIELGKSDGPSPTAADIAYLAGPAARAAASVEDRRAVCDVFFRHRVHGSVREIVPFIRDKEVSGKVSAVLRMIRAREAMPAVAELLRDPEPAVRSRALYILYEEAVREGVAAVAGAVEDPDRQVRSAAMSYAGQIRARAAIPGLVRMLPRDTHVAARALAELDAREAIPAIVATLSDRALREAIPQVLLRMDAQEAVPLLVQQVEKSAEARPGALAALAYLEVRSEAGRIARHVEDEDPMVRAYALQAAGLLRATALAELVRRGLRDAAESVRLASVFALARLEGKRAVPDLLLLLKDGDSGVRAAAVEWIGELGGAGTVGLSALLSDPEVEVRAAAAHALGNLRAADAGEALEKALKDPEEVVRIRALEALVAIGRKESLPEFRRLLAGEGNDGRASAAWGLARMGALDALEATVQFLREGGALGRSEGLFLWTPEGLLGEYVRGGAGREVLGLLKGGDDHLRRCAVEALQREGTGTLAPDLIRMLEDPALRFDAADVLGMIGGEGAIPALRKLLQDEDSDVRGAAAHGLANLGAEDATSALLSNMNLHFTSKVRSIEFLADLGRPEAVPAILELVDDSTLEIRVKATWALGRLEVRDAVPRLVAALDDRFNEVRAAAVEALGRLGGPADRFRSLLDDPYGPVRKASAEALCRAGCREGAAELVRDPRGVTPLNALRRPEVWKRLASTPLKSRLVGTRREVLTEIARQAGLGFSGEWPGLEKRVRVRGRSLLDALEAAVDPVDQVVVLEDDRILLPEFTEGWRVWRRWWREERARH